jgi:predicted PurR-regulated permease PerM
MAQSSFRRLWYAAASINLFGLVLSAGTWAFKVWLRTHTPSRPYPISFTWTLGVFCWVLGLLLFIAAWIAEGLADDPR